MKNLLSAAIFLITAPVIVFSNLVGLDGFESDASYDSRAIEEPVHHALLFRQR